jgi:uncharacterized protein with von Willebrand factor type A (vWA) domain
MACNPYRIWSGLRRRDVVLLVDTSGSVVQKRRAPASLVCAAGVAMAALERGFPITVINFSSISQRYGPTRDLKIIFKALSTFQGQGTELPSPELLRLDEHRGPLDYVLISDVAIHNLQQVLPSYDKALKSHPQNRALLFYLGTEAVQELKLMRQSGFRTEFIELEG